MTKKYLCLSCEKAVKQQSVKEGTENPSRFIKAFYITFDDVRDEMEAAAFSDNPVMYYCSYCDHPIHSATFTEDELNAMYIAGDLRDEDFKDLIKEFDED